MKTICTQIEMHIEGLISDSRTNKKLLLIRNKLIEKKKLKTKEIEFLIEKVLL